MSRAARLDRPRALAASNPVVPISSGTPRCGAGARHGPPRSRRQLKSSRHRRTLEPCAHVRRDRHAGGSALLGGVLAQTGACGARQWRRSGSKAVRLPQRRISDCPMRPVMPKTASQCIVLSPSRPRR